MRMSEPITPRRRSVSQAEVARRAGVSAQTVSRVANVSRHVDPETRQRVLTAMQDLGYQPNGAARALATGRYGTIGVVSFTLSEYGDVQTLNAIGTASQRRGFSVNLTRVDDRGGRLGDAVANLSSQPVDGLVVIEAAVLDEPSVLVPAGLPVVVTEDLPGHSYPKIGSEQASGTERAVRHLLQLGHRTVHHIAGPPRSHSARLRREVWQRTLVAAGRAVPAVPVGDWSARSGYEAGMALRADDTVTAVFCANDEMALGLMRALHEAGRRIPGDVSVVGFDGVADSAQYWPPLTTIRQDFATIGELCVRTLVAQLDDAPGQQPGPQTQLVPVELLVRESSGPPPR